MSEYFPPLVSWVLVRVIKISAVIGLGGDRPTDGGHAQTEVASAPNIWTRFEAPRSGLLRAEATVQPPELNTHNLWGKDFSLVGRDWSWAAFPTKDSNSQLQFKTSNLRDERLLLRDPHRETLTTTTTTTTTAFSTRLPPEEVLPARGNFAKEERGKDNWVYLLRIAAIMDSGKVNDFRDSFLPWLLSSSTMSPVLSPNESPQTPQLKRLLVPLLARVHWVRNMYFVLLHVKWWRGNFKLTLSVAWSFSSI